MPLRAYRCGAGHEFELVERMSDPPLPCCPEIVPEDMDGETVVMCGADVERLIMATQRPIVRDGTPNHHGPVGVES